MNDSVKEQLSACLDGALPEAELDLLLKRVARDSELQQVFGRYALITEALKGGAPKAASVAFADRVMAAVADEPASAAPTARPAAAAMSWLRPVAGLAVAAGVAAVAILAIQSPGVPTQPIAQVLPSVPAQIDSVPLTEDRYVVPTSTSQGPFVPATRLTNYVVAHSEFSSPLGRRTVLSGVLSDDDDVPQVDAGAVPTDAPADAEVTPAVDQSR